MACRNLEKGEDAKKRIIQQTDNTNIVVKQIDLSSLKSVQNFVDDVNKTEDKIDILVNNAGGGSFGKKITEDGLQMLMQTNHISVFYLTLQLLGKRVNRKLV